MDPLLPYRPLELGEEEKRAFLVALQMKENVNEYYADP